MIRIQSVSLTPDQALMPLKTAAAAALRLRQEDILEARLVKRSVDARDKSDIKIIVTLDVQCARTPSRLPKNAAEAPQTQPWTEPLCAREPAHRPVVVGLGPAGLFAALTLCKRGLKPIVLERGKSVERRTRDVNSFFATGRLDPESNALFGEGGAGAFSDGKLNTGIKDQRIGWVLKTLYEFGAPEEILYEAKPHVGTDRLGVAISGIRNEILRLGGEVRFETRLTDLIIEKGRVVGVVTDKGTIPTCGVILAPGHSARDTFEMLLRRGAPMERKPFSIGARVEHRQSWLDRAQYGALAAHPALGRADYKLNVKAPSGRGVYTFCMCPGGQVVAAASEEGGIVTNGMSVFLRDKPNCNSAVLVDVHTDDFPEAGGVLAGVEFQRRWERAAYTLAGGGFKAPAQLVGDFLKGVKSSGAGSVAPSYLPGVVWSDLTDCLPRFAAEDMRYALAQFDRRIHGFAAPDAVLTGVETRSSSPVRILRDRETFQSAIRGLYPVGEGAGYAGGITSAAVDGIRAGEAFVI
ncbi:MAG: hypothetical protein IJU28_07145 [Clostridia bacterium]|nr:hypothetical protein [Clostridia bacterium]